MKLWDCWVYPDWDASLEEILLAPTDDDAPYSAPAGLSIDQVAARLLESELADWGSQVRPDGSIDLAVAIREHGSGRTFRLFRARLLALQAEEVAWPFDSTEPLKRDQAA